MDSRPEFKSTIPFIRLTSFTKNLLCAGTVLSTGDRAMNKSDKASFCPLVGEALEQISLMEEIDKKREKFIFT